MKTCPKCSRNSSVVESRQTNEHTRRRRECQNFKCQAKWTTYEIHSDQFDKINKYNNLKTILTQHIQ